MRLITINLVVVGLGLMAVNVDGVMGAPSSLESRDICSSQECTNDDNCGSQCVCAFTAPGGGGLCSPVCIAKACMDDTDCAVCAGGTTFKWFCEKVTKRCAPPV
ncbi:hypothetical protein C8T65DRAFT_746306 [Cerioporus squamosus]|nr:hypothetical protein C8T65DRAFT_746306 [Cerioporus squamosus]